MDARSTAARLEEQKRLPKGDGDRLLGYAVFALPFESGDVLALRRFPASSFGPAYTAVWHRDAAGRWTIFADHDADVTCPRFFGRAFHEFQRVPIHISWTHADAFEVRVADRIVWRLSLRASLATRLMTLMGRLLPESWGRPALLAPMSRMARPMLRAGRIRLNGKVPNGQWFRASPVAMWRVADSSASIEGRMLGRPAPLARQEHLADFWLQQRGLFGAVRLVFQPYDPTRNGTDGLVGTTKDRPRSRVAGA